MMAAVTHRVAEERSLALHRGVARRLRKDPEVLERARRRVQRWLADGSVPQRRAVRWAEILAGTVEEVAGVITDTGQEARDLRQVSPFAGALDARERWAILRQLHDEAPAR
jgi:hypothetical protein